VPVGSCRLGRCAVSQNLPRTRCSCELFSTRDSKSRAEALRWPFSHGPLAEHVFAAWPGQSQVRGVRGPQAPLAIDPGHHVPGPTRFTADRCGSSLPGALAPDVRGGATDEGGRRGPDSLIHEGIEKNVEPARLSGQLGGRHALTTG